MAPSRNDLPYLPVSRRPLIGYLLGLLLLLLLGLGAVIDLLAQEMTLFAWVLGITVVILSPIMTKALLLEVLVRRQHGGVVLECRGAAEVRQTFLQAGATTLLADPYADDDRVIDWTTMQADRPRTGEAGQTAMPMYDLFLSYHAPDRPAAIIIAERLRKAGLRLWFDQDEILAGHQWMGRIEQGLRRSRAIAVIIGPSGMGCWQEQEVVVAIRLAVKAGGARPVIPVLLPGADRHNLPLLLDSFSWVEFRQSLDDDAAFTRLVAGVQARTIVATPSEFNLSL